MHLPGADRAIVENTKVRDYLLSPEHPVGRFKAVFFGALGYTRDQWQRLQQICSVSAGPGQRGRARRPGSGRSTRSVVSIRDHRAAVLKCLDRS